MVASVVFGFTENGLVCARQKHVLILQHIDTLESMANPLFSCRSCSFNIPSLVLGKRLRFRASSLCIESYLTRIWDTFQIDLFAYIIPLHILVTPHSNLVAKEDYTFIGNRGGFFFPCCHPRGFIFHLDLPSPLNTQRTGSVLVLMVY